MNQRRCGDLQVHRSNSDSLLAKVFVLLSRRIVERQPRPAAEVIDQIIQLGIREDLSLDILRAVNLGQPAAHLLFERNGSRDKVLVA